MNFSSFALFAKIDANFTYTVCKCLNLARVLKAHCICFNGHNIAWEEISLEFIYCMLCKSHSCFRAGKFELEEAQTRECINAAGDGQATFFGGINSYQLTEGGKKTGDIDNELRED